MNNYIAASIVLPIMLALAMQFGVQVQTHYAVSEFQSIVDVAKEQAKQTGYFSPEILSKLKTDLTEAYSKVSAEDLVIDVTTVPKYRTDEYDERELIQYRIGLPINELIAAHKFWGMSDADNKTVYYLEGAVASERLNGEETL